MADKVDSRTKYHFVHGAWSLNKKDGVLSGFGFMKIVHEAVTITVLFNAEPITLVANKFHSEIHKPRWPKTRAYVWVFRWPAMCKMQLT